MKVAAAIAAALLAAPPPGSDAAPTPDWTRPHAGNPLIPGYFADPSIIAWRGEYFLYATIDPWGGERLGLWRSRNLRDWTFSTPNWPTKAAATSPTSNGSRVWAPSVVRGRDGRFWMYVSVGSEVWVGVAEHPAGPWRDANHGKPLIPGNFRPGYHMIDAEAFVDDDGQAYLYWGSGLRWVNGRCFAVKLNPDMTSFDGEPVDVTPAHYFEAPFLFKANGRYFLTYSWGNTTKDTYQVRYGVGKSPLGPFVEPEDAPLLSTDAARAIISPGHHAIVRLGGRPFVLYHRQGLPFPPTGDTVLRQIAIDRLDVAGDRLRTVVPTHRGPLLPGAAARRAPGAAMRFTASAAIDGLHGADRAGDDNYATAWDPGSGRRAWVIAERRSIGAIGASQVRPAFADRPLDWTLDASDDGVRWRRVGAGRDSGSPIRLPAAGRARQVRLTIADNSPILEWHFPAGDGR